MRPFKDLLNVKPAELVCPIDTEQRRRRRHHRTGLTETHEESSQVRICAVGLGPNDYMWVTTKKPGLLSDLLGRAYYIIKVN